MLDAVRTRRCSRWVSLFVLMTGRTLAALQLLGFVQVHCCRCAVRCAASFPLCAAATSVTTLLAPVCQGAAQPRAVLPDRPSATIGTYAGALGEDESTRHAHAACRGQRRLCATGDHMRMASSRAPTAPRQLRRSPAHVMCMDRRTCEGELSRKMYDVSVPRCDAIGAPVWVVF